MRFTVVLVLLFALPLGGPDASRQIAITFDDLPVASVVDDGGKSWPLTASTLRAALLRHRVPAVGFVNEQKLERGGAVDPTRVEYLREWVASFELGNHTYSHLDYHSADLELFQRDVVRGETITRQLADAAGKPLRFFRHPFLHTGRSLAARRALERFLAERGYRVAPVTIDNFDYVFAAAYERIADSAMQDTIANEYLSYLTGVVAYYERQATAIAGRDIPQVLLLHATALNARVFDDLATMLRARGYRFVSLETALADPIYSSPDSYIGPGGITWLHRWALATGGGGSFSGEPLVPKWIEQAALPPTQE